MADITLPAQARTVVGKKVKTLRKQGLIPGTIYGPKTDPVNVQFVYRTLEVALMKAGGTNLIDIEVDGESHRVLAREVQREVLKGDIMHVDFFAIDADSVIRADIPVHLIGSSPVVEAREGILLTGTNNITIETLPDKLIDQIEVDLSKLQAIGDAITVADLDLGEDILIISEPEEMLARVSQTSAARAELLETLEDEESVDVQEGAEPEVIARGKEEDEFEDE